MISHASMDAKIGTAWQRLLKRVFPESKLRYSSDPRDPAFSGYGAFASEIRGWIEQSRYILTVQTLTSISSAIHAKKYCQYLSETLALNRHSGTVCQNCSTPSSTGDDIIRIKDLKLFHEISDLSNFSQIVSRII